MRYLVVVPLGPQYFIKNTEGGAKYQVGFLEVPLLSEVAKLCENKLISLWEHKLSQAGP